MCQNKNMYHDKHCVFIITKDREFIKHYIDKERGKCFYEKLISNNPKSKVILFKVQKSVFKEYKKTFDYKLLVNNSIIG